MRLKSFIAILTLIFSIGCFAKGNVFIDGKKIKTREDMQRLLEKQMQLPANAGKDLDAIYAELLSESKSASVVRLKHLDSLKRKTGDQYVEDFIDAVNMAAEENAKVILVLE